MSVIRFRNYVYAILTVAVLGCGSGKVSMHSSNGGTPNGNQEASATADDVMASALFQVRPENFGINANTDKPVSLLNSWRFKQSEKNGTVEESVLPSAPKDWYPNDKEQVLSQSKFDLADAIHIRDALLFRAVSGYLSDRGRNELQRVQAVIDYVCRNVSLWKNSEVELPLKPFMSLMLGRGTIDDRAWVSAEILRQLRIDSLIVRAKSDEKEVTDKWLFGAVIEGKVYLFDLSLGLPITNGMEGKETAPATLNEIVAHPEWLEQMSAKGPYRLSIDDLKEPNLYLISDPHFWCQRMKRLELVLPASDNCVIYEGLMDADGKSTPLTRVVSASGRTTEALKLWSFSKSFDERSSKLTAEMNQQMQMLTVPFVVPIPVKQDEKGKTIQGTPERKMERYRIMHLMGEFSDATQRYLSIRHLELDKKAAEINQLNKMASEDALYWTALCKIESDDQPGTIELLNSYLKKYDRNGKWYFTARTLLAQTHANAGQIPQALSLLERSSSEDPNQAANAIRLKRWSAMQAK